MNKTDVLVAGSGLAGLVAALAAAQAGKSVRLVSKGQGTLLIAGGSIDVLGYLGDSPVAGDPLASIPLLPASHPYRLLGAERVRESLDFVHATLVNRGLPLSRSAEENTWIPTIVGTFRPTYFSNAGAGLGAILHAGVQIKPVLVVGIEGVKDCHAGMALMELRKNPRLSRITFALVELPNPLGSPHRNTTPLDVARFLDTPEGQQWLLRSFGPHKIPGGTVLVPPILGLDHHKAIAQRLRAATGMEFVEMVSLPPGVGGERIQRILRRALQEMGVLFSENTTLMGAEVSGTRCIAVESAGPDKKRRWLADNFIIATGGILGGGIITEPALAREAVFGVPIAAPATVDAWSEHDIFASQPYARLGVAVNARLQPVDPTGRVLLENVYFAGKTLAGYDFTAEKSGHGVALATGFHAACQCSCATTHVGMGENSHG